jgi:hypothetical protein
MIEGYESSIFNDGSPDGGRVDGRNADNFKLVGDQYHA